MPIAHLPRWVEGALSPTITVTWRDEESEQPIDLTNATISGTIRNAYGGGGNGAVRAIAGTIEVEDGPAGESVWTLAAGDAVGVGIKEVQFEAAFASGPTPAITLIAHWEITRRNQVTS